MPYALAWEPRALRLFETLPRPAQERLVAAIDNLASNPYPPPPHGRKLTDGGGYRLRVGDYRVIYEVDSTARRVVVTWVGPRRDAYRRR